MRLFKNHVFPESPSPKFPPEVMDLSGKFKDPFRTVCWVHFEIFQGSGTLTHPQKCRGMNCSSRPACFQKCSTSVHQLFRRRTLEDFCSVSSGYRRHHSQDLVLFYDFIAQKFTQRDLTCYWFKKFWFMWILVQTVASVRPKQLLHAKPQSLSLKHSAIVGYFLNQNKSCEPVRYRLIEVSDVSPLNLLWIIDCLESTQNFNMKNSQGFEVLMGKFDSVH